MKTKDALALAPPCKPRGRGRIGMTLGVILALASGLSAHCGAPAYRDQPPIGAATQERYRIALDGAPILGPSDAKVTIVEYVDFQCPACTDAAGVLARVMKRHETTVRVVFKHFPLPGHPRALPAAEAAMAAAEQGKFWEMSERLLQNQEALDRPSLEKHAEDLRLDLDRFKAALDSGKHRALVEANVVEARRFGAKGAPTFFFNGRRLEGGRSEETFERVIAEEVAAADRALSTGVAPEQVYEALTKGGLEKAPPRPEDPGRAGTL
jgi:protein-disulfide isomerase